MNNHTPGPWHLGSGANTGKNYAVCSGAQILARVTGFGYPLGTGADPRSDANARLIAAAPELLSALNSFWLLVDHLQRCANPKDWATYGDWGKLQRTAAQAIAKATQAAA